jgi:hypothetical protein
MLNGSLNCLMEWVYNSWVLYVGETDGFIILWAEVHFRFSDRNNQNFHNNIVISHLHLQKEK